MREWINEYLRGPTQYPRDNRHAAKCLKISCMMDTKEWPCAFYSWITGWQKWLSNTNRSEEGTTDKLRKQVGMISSCQKCLSVPCHPHRFTQDTVSDFLCFSTSAYSSSSHWLQMATLFTEGWGVSWRKMELSKSTSHSRSLVPSSVEALGVPAS